ncbi:UNKNOWN [Stylonychia lemnae]|uniref:Uncharacterized protein n=1 Tax=Stylonychia lemnae TaxID=5949 RepID=A0A077ZWM1_STYLE|nr:UNKNOWN [Stylonychia lemnae]|eukprot:CDW72876.1 UNKNOWN [Stylonychia lemnae]
MSASLGELLSQCLENKQGFDNFSDSIAAYVGDTTKNIKLQQPIVNLIKQTIKSKTHTSTQKLLSLRLLHKCFQKKNKEFNKYVDKKILSRLVILAQHNKQKNQETELIYKGETIFSEKDPDKNSAAAFLVLLLDCIEQWSKIYPLQDDNKTPSNYVKQYVALQQKKILFPSQCRGNPLASVGLVEESRLSRHNTNNSQANGQNRAKSDIRKASDNGQQIQKQLDTKKVAEELKAKMQKAKSVAKKSETFLAQLERNNFQADPSELIAMDQSLSQGKENCEFSIDQLMNEAIRPLISNSEQLLQQMLSYQEQILTAIAIIQPLCDSLKQEEKKAYKQFETSKQNSSPLKRNTVAKPKTKNAFATHAVEEKKNDEGGDLWSQLDQFATGVNQTGNSNQVTFGVGQIQQPIIDENDPFADAIREMQNVRQKGFQPEEQKVVKPVQQQPQQQQQQQAQEEPTDFFSRYNMLAQPESYDFNPPQEQNPQNNDYYDNQYNQQPMVSPNKIERQDSDHELDVIVNQPPPQEEEALGHVSLFKLVQEGKFDLESESRKKKQIQQQHSYPNYDQQDYNQYNNQYDNNQYQYNDSNGYQNQAQNSYQDNYYAGGGANDTGDQASEYKKKIESLKSQNMTLLTSNQMLKERVKNMESQQNSYQNDDMALQNQQLEQSMNNLRDYYEREMDNKDYQIKNKDYEIQQLMDEVNQLRSQLGMPPRESNQQVQAINSQQHQNNSYGSHSYQNAMMHNKFKQELTLRHLRMNQVMISIIYKSDLVQHISVNDEYDPKLDNLYFKSVFSDKFLIYDDENIQMGCIRSVSNEWRLITLKFFIGNKSQALPITNVQFQSDIQHVRIKDEDKFPEMISPKEQLEVVIYIGAQVLFVPSIKFCYQRQDVPMKWQRLKLPANPMYFCEPFNVTAAQFKSFWGFTKFPRSTKFDLDMKRASNLQQIKKILTLNEKHGLFVQGVDAKPNIVGYSGNHLEGYVFIMLEISASGTGCVLTVKTEVSDELTQKIMEYLLDLVAVKQQ